MADVWSILEAIDGLVGDRFPFEMKLGLIGAPMLLHSGAELRLSDINLLILPGLPALGIEASVHYAGSLSELASAVVRRSTPLALLVLSESPIHIESQHVEFDGAESIAEVDPVVIDQAVVMRDQAAGKSPLLWRVSPGAEAADQQPRNTAGPWALITFKRARRTGLSSSHVTSALLRWLAFAAANPDRLISPSDEAQTNRAASFLSDCCGSGRSPSETRLRRTAEAFRSANISEAFEHLKDAVLMRIGIDSTLRTAMTLPLTIPLADTQRRELIYLARAGTTELKVLAVHRLALDNNFEHPDIRITLQQMRYDENVWVRLAAEERK